MNKDRFNITVLIGTRPEAIKMAPVVRALDDTGEYEIRILLSGQQMEMSITALRAFNLNPKQVFMSHLKDFSLSGQASDYLDALHRYFKERPADLMLVHGDTAIGFIGALAALYQRVPVGHVEAGLRSNDLKNPFPEEAHRRLIDPLCDLHFAPTERARQNLIKENTDENTIVVTGNTVVDAVHQLAERPPALNQHRLLTEMAVAGQRVILVTAHRRENWGASLEEICQAVRKLADNYHDVIFVIPVHPNPNVSETVHSVLNDHPRVLLIPPLDDLELLAVMRQCYLILTDSEGIQEEAPCVGTPVLILREAAERPELVEGGGGHVVGTRRDDILAHTSNLLDNPASHEKMQTCRNPFGDGNASARIERAIDNWRFGRPLNHDNADFYWRPPIVPTMAAV